MDSAKDGYSVIKLGCIQVSASQKIPPEGEGGEQGTISDLKFQISETGGEELTSVRIGSQTSGSNRGVSQTFAFFPFSNI